MSKVNAVINADQSMTVSFGGESRTFDVYNCGERFTAFAVMSGRFRTGAKLWPLSVTVWGKSGNVTIDNGGYSNKGGVRSVVGWWNADSKLNSQNR